MSHSEDTPDKAKTRLSFRRRAVRVSQETLIKTDVLFPGRTLPLVIQPAVAGVDLLSWATCHQALIERYMLEHGGILFRDFRITEVTDFERFMSAISDELLPYVYRLTPRRHVSGNIYTSTDYPADQAIPLHNEESYSTSWPMKIGFFCVQPPSTGGETPIADSRKVCERIPPTIQERFRQYHVLYVRHYGTGLDLPWQEVFQTDKKAEVEDFCHRAGIEYAWQAGNHLRTRQVCQAMVTHPQTHDRVWFNQAHLFHISSLTPTVRASLLAEFREADLPRNAYYGDGTPIEDATLDVIREAYAAEMVRFPWQQGDILLLDNVLTAHGRMPYTGPRNIVVGMTEPFTAMKPDLNRD